MTKLLGHDITNMMRRRQQVSLIMSRLTSEGKQITGIIIKQELEKLSRPIKADLKTIYRDIIAINSENTFVRDIAQYNYSRLCEDAWNNYAWIYGEARRLYDKKWTLNRKITRKTSDGIIIETVETEELASAKLGFLKIMIEAQQSIDDLREGRMTSISVAMINNEFVHLKEQLEEAKKKLEESDDGSSRN